MTDTTSSVRMTAATRLYLYVSLSLVAMLVLLPLVTTALGGFKSLGDLRVNPFGLPSNGCGRTISISFSATATGGRC